MFRGRFENTIDSKGRISVPAKFREVCAASSDNRLIVTNFDTCLWAYSIREWEAIEQKVAALPQFKAEVRALQRVFISAATECSIDGHGRIMIPQALREYAEIEKEVMFVGMVKRIEIWSKKRWAAEFEKSQNTINASLETLAELGL